MLVEDGTCTLLVLESLGEDSGVYECVAFNKAGEARCSAEVKIEGPKPDVKAPPPPKGKGGQAPQLLENLKGQIVQEGQSATFSCTFASPPGII